MREKALVRGPLIEKIAVVLILLVYIIASNAGEDRGQPCQK